MHTNKQSQTNLKITTLLLGISALLTISNVSWAAGLLKSTNNASQNDIYMKSHIVNVTINNGFAKTEVDQIFDNRSAQDLEAIYSFPVPKQASLSEVSLWIDGNEVIGEVLEKERAAKTYQDQKNKGNKTALAEKNDYFSFEISVYPVKVNEDTRIRLVYYQPLEIDSNVGRYVYPLEEGGTDDENIQFWSVNDTVEENFQFNLELKSAFPVKDIRLPGYMDKAVINNTDNAANNIDNTPDTEVNTDAGSQYHFTAKIDNKGQFKLQQDIVVYYRLADDIPARIELIPYREDKNSDGTIMAVITPAADLQPITEGSDWVFILDKSGSMAGGKILSLTNGVAKVLGKMNPNDRYRIITFDNTARDFTSGYIPATQENINNTITSLNSIVANNGTNLYEGLKMGYKKLDDDRTTNVILVTDGVANIGETGHKAFVELLNKYDIRLFTFIIGNSANQPLLEKLTKVSNGFAMNISNNDDIVGRIMQAKAKVLYQNMHDVELKFYGEKVYDLTPAEPTSLYRGQQLVVFGKYNGSGPVEMELKAKISGEQKSWRCKAYLPEQDTLNPELERMWALSHIDSYMQEIRDFGENETLRGKVVALGQEYSLVTDYTSMLVMSEEAFESESVQRKNAGRVHKERTAQQQKHIQPAKNYRIDNNTDHGNNNGGSFDNRRSPGFGGGGGGPVGPIVFGLLLWNKRNKKKAKLSD